MNLNALRTSGDVSEKEPVWPAAQPTTKPEGQPVAEVEAQPVAERASEPLAKPVAKQIVLSKLHPAPEMQRSIAAAKKKKKVTVEVTPVRLETPSEIASQRRASQKTKSVSGELKPALLEMAPTANPPMGASPSITPVTRPQENSDSRSAARRISAELTPTPLEMMSQSLARRPVQALTAPKSTEPTAEPTLKKTAEPTAEQTAKPTPEPSEVVSTKPVLAPERPSPKPARKPKPAKPNRAVSLKLRSQFRELLYEIKRKAETMKIDHPLLPPLVAKVEREHFRVAVVGKSNRGKSTFINALLGIPGLLPTDSLPGAPSIVEVKSSNDYSFERTKSALSSHFVASDADSFRASVLTPSATDDEVCGRWRVGVPSDSSLDMAIDLVDTPPIGQAASLDRRVVEEAAVADAIFFILDITQAPSAMELQLMGDLADQTKGLFVVFNRADTTHPTEWPSIERDVRSRLKTKGLSLPDRGFHFLSALRAETATSGPRSRGLWHNRITEIREELRGYLRRLDEAAKLEPLARGSERLVASFNKSVKAKLVKLSDKIAEGADSDSTTVEQKTYRLSSEESQEAHNAVEQARALLEHSDPLIHALMSRFWQAWPSLGKSLNARKGTWTSDHSPVLAPKKHVEEVAQKAKKDTVALVQRWMVDHGGPIIEEELQGRIDVADNALAPLTAYLRHKGFSESGMDREHWQRVLAQAFQGPMSQSEADLMQTCGSLAATVASGTLSVVLGYVVADVVLFYMLGLVGGFLSPPLLLAALGAGTAIHFFVGRQAVVGRIQNKVHRTIVEKVAIDNNRLKLDHAVNIKVGELLQQLAETFAVEAHELVERAEQGTLKLPEKRVSKNVQQPQRLQKEGSELLAALSALNRFSHQIIGSSVAA
jgi:GTP-binding protein EngB required for normal cell division